MATVNKPPQPASFRDSGDRVLPAVKNPPPLPAAGAAAASRDIPTSPVPAPTCVEPSLPSAIAMRCPVPAHPVESSRSVAGVDVASRAPTDQASPPPPSSSPPPPAAATESSSVTPELPWSEFWWPEDEVTLLNALVQYRRRHGNALPRGVDLVMAVFGRLKRTDYSLADLEAKIDALKKRFKETDAVLCAGTGGPAAGHETKMYKLSLDIWGAAVTTVAAPKPNPPAPVVNPPVKKNPAGRVPCAESYRAPKRRRYEEIRTRCPKLAGMVEELMRKALEGVSDVDAWSMEMRISNQELVGGVAVPRAEDGLKEMTSLITRLV